MLISKLVVASEMTDHINSNGPGNKNQSSYKVGNSPETVLLSIRNEFQHSLSKG